MVSTYFRDYGKQLLAQHRISMSRIDVRCGGSCG